MSTAVAPSPSRPRLRARKMGFNFADRSIPRYWMGDSPLFTHMANGLNLLFPKGERFFIRSVQAFLDRVDDPALRERVAGFVAQEVRHGMEHEAIGKVLESQGYDVQAFLERYDRLVYRWLEPRLNPSVRLAMTAALEHYTAMLGEVALIERMPHAHPALRELLLWHAAEEIEHKSVAHDVFQTVDGRYAVRVAGLLVATAGLLLFWYLASRDLLRQDRALAASGRVPRQHRSLARRAREAYLVFWKRPVFRGMARQFLDYLRPGFHPDQHDNYPLARDYLREIGRLDG